MNREKNKGDGHRDRQQWPACYRCTGIFVPDRCKRLVFGRLPHVGGNEGDMRHARLFGYVKTDINGKFELHTIKPSGYPGSDLPAQIHVHVWAKGYRNFVNEFLFDDDERLVGEIREQSIQNRFLVQKPEKAAAPFEQQFSYSIKLDKQ